MAKVYISARQCGKTTALVKQSAETGIPIAVASYQMAKHVQTLAKQLKLDIPEPVTYTVMYREYLKNKQWRWLVDEVHLMLQHLGVVSAILDESSYEYLANREDGYSAKTMFFDDLVSPGERMRQE